MIFFKNNHLFFLSIFISFFISGCYSFFEVSKDEYLKKENHNTTKIILESKQEIIIDASENLRISPSEDAILFTRDSIDIRIALTEINKIKEQDYDMGKTFFTLFWSVMAGLVVFALILIQLGVSYR